MPISDDIVSRCAAKIETLETELEDFELGKRKPDRPFGNYPEKTKHLIALVDKAIVVHREIAAASVAKIEV